MNSNHIFISLLIFVPLISCEKDEVLTENSSNDSSQTNEVLSKFSRVRYDIANSLYQYSDSTVYQIIENKLSSILRYENGLVMDRRDFFFTNDRLSEIQEFDNQMNLDARLNFTYNQNNQLTEILAFRFNEYAKFQYSFMGNIVTIMISTSVDNLNYTTSEFYGNLILDQNKLLSYRPRLFNNISQLEVVFEYDTDDNIIKQTNMATNVNTNILLYEEIINTNYSVDDNPIFSVMSNTYDDLLPVYYQFFVDSSFIIDQFRPIELSPSIPSSSAYHLSLGWDALINSQSNSNGEISTIDLMIFENQSQIHGYEYRFLYE